MDYAHRIGEIPPYLFAEIDKAIAGKKAQGVDVISLGIGDPDNPTPENIINALRKASEKPENHKYPSYAGMTEFRSAAADYIKKRFNVTLNPEEEVLTLIGSKEGIAHIPLAFINPGDTVLCSNPGYPVYEIGTILAGGTPIPVPLTKENDFKPDLSSIDSETALKAKLMHVNYPNNPTAATADKKFYEELIDFARENGIIICHDAAYSEVCFDDYQAPSFLEEDGAKEVGIEFHSLSKTYNMTGWRIGFAAGNKDIIEGLGKVKQNIDSGAFNAIQEAGIEALTGPQESVAENNRIIEKRRDLMVKGLGQLGWEVPTPKATFYLWVPVPEKDYTSIEYSKKVLDETGVVVTPGVGFGEYGEGYIRISLTQGRDRLEEALERLSKIT